MNRKKQLQQFNNNNNKRTRIVKVKLATSKNAEDSSRLGPDTVLLANTF